MSKRIDELPEGFVEDSNDVLAFHDVSDGPVGSTKKVKKLVLQEKINYITESQASSLTSSANTTLHYHNYDLDLANHYGSLADPSFSNSITISGTDPAINIASLLTFDLGSAKEISFHTSIGRFSLLNIRIGNDGAPTPLPICIIVGTGSPTLPPYSESPSLLDALAYGSLFLALGAIAANNTHVYSVGEAALGIKAWKPL